MPRLGASTRKSMETPTTLSLCDDACARYSLDLADQDLVAELRSLHCDTSANGNDGDARSSMYGARSTITTWDEAQAVVDDIHESLIGRTHLFDTPFGAKAIAYADWTASGRALACIEDYLRSDVLPHYGNTHTTTSITGLQTTSFREEARQVIAQAVNAKISGKTSEDCVLFTGQGTTSAINKMVSALGLQLPLPSANDRSAPNPNDRPIVFVGPFEHHSNILPWRESCADVIQVPESADGKLDVAFLVEKLQFYAARPLKIGSFSAASNLTGILSDVDHLSAVLHMHGALAFWDYASCAPYVEIDMNPIVHGPMRPYVYKDAIFFSGHKFVGGPNTPGVLVCKKRLLGNAVPTAPGGGTVFFVTEHDHRYSANKVEREEGGTPDIIGSIRLGLAFEVKQRVDPVNIMALESRHLETVRASLARNANLVLLGRNALPKIPIFSFLVRFGDRFLHFNFVCALLNDLFGIQTRGGCQCAGPYATRILGITDDLLFAFERAMVDKQLVLRAGFSRISFPYFLSDADVEYLLDALHFVANDGWKFLPFYRFNHKSGVWKHHSRFTKFPNRRWLAHFATSSAAASSSSAACLQTLTNDELLAHQQANLTQARQLADGIMDGSVSLPINAHAVGEIRDSHYDKLRWFAYPSEAAAAIRTGVKPVTTDAIAGPVQPQKYFAHDPALAYSASHSLSAFAPLESEITGIREEDSDDGNDHEAVATFVQSRAVGRLERRRSSLSYIGSEPLSLTDNSSSTSPTTSTSNNTSPRGSVAPHRRSIVSFGATETLTDSSRSFQPRANRSSSLPVPRTMAPSSRQARLTRSASAPVTSQSFDRVEDHKRPLRSAEAASANETTTSPFDHALKSTKEINKKINSARVFPTPPPALLKWVGLAISHWQMIREGDRLLVAVSGGKDSLGLLHVLLHLQKKSPVKFTIACATVDPETPAYDPSPLVGYIQSLGMGHHYLRENLIQRATKQLRGQSILSYTARMKRGALYSCCRKHKYNKLVLGHHLDDFAESFFMSAMHNGQLRTMRASYWNDKKDVHVVRPLVYAREQLLTQFATDACLPVINENMPAGFEEPKERQRVKGMLSKEESLFPELFGSLRRALEPLLSDEPPVSSALPPPSYSTVLNETCVASGSGSSGSRTTQPHGECEQAKPTSSAKGELRKRDKMREALRSLLRSIAT